MAFPQVVATRSLPLIDLPYELILEIAETGELDVISRLALRHVSWVESFHPANLVHPPTLQLRRHADGSFDSPGNMGIGYQRHACLSGKV